MTIHIGKNIHVLIKTKGIKAKTVAQAINVSESSLYKIYNRKTIDIDKLIKFSQYLDANLFIHYFEQEPLKSMFLKENEELASKVKLLQSSIDQKEKRIKELEEINASQQRILNLLETSEDTVPIIKTKKKRI